MVMVLSVQYQDPYQPTFVQASVWQRLIFAALHSEGEVVARLFYPTQIVTMAIGIIYCIYFFKLLTSLTSVGCKHSQSWHMLLQKSCSKLSMARFNETALDNSELLTPKLSNSLRQNCGLLQSWKERDRNWHFHFRYSWQLLSQMGVPFSYIKSAISWPDGVSLFHQDWG